MDLTGAPLSLKEDGFNLITPPDPFDMSTYEMERLKEELKMWKERVAKAEKANGDLLLCKLSAEEEYVKVEEELIKLKNIQKNFAVIQDTHEREFNTLHQENAELKRDIQKLKEDLTLCSSGLSQVGQIKKKVAEKKLKFSHMEDLKHTYPDINTHCVFGVAAKIPFRLNQNHALITFEDEEAVQRLTRMGKHTVNLDANKTADVSVKPFTLEMGCKFELRVVISGKKINVSDIPELPIQEDWMRDKLELNFYKPPQGGEVENVTYNSQSRTAVITFLRPGVTNSFVRCTKYPFLVDGRCYMLSVLPHFSGHLEKFQLYSGISKKTILLKGIKEIEDDEESVQDMIEIHFQRPANSGGEIEKIKYVSKGVTWVCFEEDV